MNVTDRALNLATMARSFVDHPYWARMSRQLANSEKAEMETLLDPTSTLQQQMLSRAAVAYIRKLQAMPFIDLKQGEEAAKAIERFDARAGNEGWSTPKAHSRAER